jgi:cytoskeleton protein RodZ
VAPTPTYCLEGAGNTKIALSQESLRTVFSQVEAELYHSETYRRALSSLQKTLGEAIEGPQALIKSACREAIRLALRQLVKQYQVPATTEQGKLQNAAASLLAQQEIAASAQEPVQDSIPLAQSKPQSKSEAAAGSLVVSQKASIRSKLKRSNTSNLSKADSGKLEPVAQPPSPPREVLVRQIGQELRHARQAKSLSLNQLHGLTWIPIHQLKALEDGQVEQLPEDVYVRGFIRRVGDALELDGTRMAASLPTPNVVESVVPSWQISPETSPCLRPVHLYLGYAALMAGAVGGLAWMSQQPFPDGAFNPESDSSHELSSAQTGRSQRLDVIPGVRASGAGAIAGTDLAPPETLPF